ncbi:MAG: type II and III secretion system protein family protein [Noviherbaspirillum sp.]
MTNAIAKKSEAPMKISGIFCFLLAMFAVAPASAADQPGITLAVREQRALGIPQALERIAVADPEVADVVVTRGSGNMAGSVLVVGKKAGTTTVTAWPKGAATITWKVRVLGDLQSALADRQGAQLQLQGSTALISGSAPSLLSHAATTAAAAEAVGKGAVLDTSTVATGGVVQIDVKIVEMSKLVLKEAGFDFLLNATRGDFVFNLAGNLAPVQSAFSLLTSLTRSGETLRTNLKLMESNGLVRVLAEPSLTALSGQSASFLAGGELPIPQSGGLGTTTIVYKPFGIGLTVTPTVLAANRIALKVAPEASDIDFAHALIVADTSIPAITTRRADTMVELGSGESFIIGGLVSRNTRSNVSKIPFLGDLPIIGAFFRSLSYTQDEKELVIVVTPYLVRPIAAGTALPLPGDGKERRDTPGNAWGAYLLGTAGRDELPGFSK